MADFPKETLMEEKGATPRFSTLDWEPTPEPVKRHLLWVHEIVSKYEQTIAQLRARVESLEANRNENSSNSNVSFQ